MKAIRQGDVILVPCEKPTGDAVEHKELTLALGEATGHHHTVYPEQKTGVVREWKNKDGRFIEVDSRFWLRHQEHAPVRIDPGQYYRIGEESEYDPFAKEMKKVID